MSNSLIDQVTKQSALCFYAIANTICGSRNVDIVNSLTWTAELSDHAGNKLYKMTDDQYTLPVQGDIEHLLNVISDVFEGERYGIGYDICEQIEHHLKQGRQAVASLHEIAKTNFVKQVYQ